VPGSGTTDPVELISKSSKPQESNVLSEKKRAWVKAVRLVTPMNELGRLVSDPTTTFRAIPFLSTPDTVAMPREDSCVDRIVPVANSSNVKSVVVPAAVKQLPLGEGQVIASWGLPERNSACFPGLSGLPFPRRMTGCAAHTLSLPRSSC